MVLTVLSPCLAVTVAPGMDTPVSVTVPVWSDCASAVIDAQTMMATSHEAMEGRNGSRTSPCKSVLRWLFDAVDDDHLHRSLSGFEPEAKLLLQRGGQGGGVRIDRGQFGSAGRRQAGRQPASSRVWHKRQREVVSSLEPRFVEHRPPNLHSHRVGKGRHGLTGDLKT